MPKFDVEKVREALDVVAAHESVPDSMAILLYAACDRIEKLEAVRESASAMLELMDRFESYGHVIDLLRKELAVLGANEKEEDALMPPTSLRVSLLSMTPNAEALIYAAAKQCVSEYDASVLFESAVNSHNVHDFDFMDVGGQVELIRRVMASGHLGVVEPAQFSFGVAGVSRALSHQLVRHRLASYSQQSQRYVKADGFDYVLPPSILKNFEANNLYCNMMELINQAYERLRKNHGIPAEDARFVLPNACETKIVVTMNARSLLHFFEQRCCLRAQWEIRALANEMLLLCKEAVPVIFEKAGAACVRKGFCEEDKCCGRAPRLKDVIPYGK